jgi:hypothetical protein
VFSVSPADRIALTRGTPEKCRRQSWILQRPLQPRDNARGCHIASTPCDRGHGVVCWVRVVVTLVDGGGTDVVVVRWVVVV